MNELQKKDDYFLVVNWVGITLNKITCPKCQGHHLDRQEPGEGQEFRGKEAS